MTFVSLDPRTADGKPIHLPCLFPGGVYLYLTGAGDHLTNGRGQGSLFLLTRSEEGLIHAEWQFLDWVYLAGGLLQWTGAVAGDYISLMVYAPATSVTANGQQTGNCNLVDSPYGAGTLIVPAAGDGAYDVNLSTAVPIPAFDEEQEDQGTGYWDWSAPKSGSGEITPSASPGTALWHLLTVDIPLVRFANRLVILGTGVSDLTVPAVKPKKILPQWKGKVSLYHGSGTHTLQIGWCLTTARCVTL